MIPGEKFYRPREIAKILGVAEHTVYMWITNVKPRDDVRLRALDIGGNKNAAYRVVREDLHAFLVHRGMSIETARILFP